MAELGINLVRRCKHSCLAKWTVPYNPELQPNKMICSPWFKLGDFEFRSVIVPGSNALALALVLGPDAFLSLQVKDNSPRYSFRFGPLASYKLSILNHEDESKSLTKAFKLTLFTRNTNIPAGGSLQLTSSVLGPRSGFFKNGSLHCSIEISILDESFSFSFSRDGNNDTEMVDYSAHSLGCDAIVLGGKFKWKIKNFSFFKEMIESRQQMSSAVFLLGRGFAHISASTTKVNGVECLSLFLEANQMHTCPKCMGHNKPSWCLFCISVLSQKAWRSHMHKHSYGRLNKTTPALGWTDYMKISDLIGPNNGFVMNNTVEFTVSFKAIKDSAAVLTSGFKEFGALNKSGSCTWKIENFTRLKNILKKKKMIGVSVESSKFQIEDHEFRLIVFPRGRYQKPIYLSMIIEASGPQDATQDWSCFAHCRLSVVNKKNKDNSIFKETQGRFSEATKRWALTEFLTLATLFNKGSGYLVEDTVMFNADILILKESLEIQDVLESSNKDGEKGRCTITWEMKNFLAFHQTSSMINDICSKYFQVDKLKLRIGETCDPSDLVEDLYVRYKMTVVNKKHPAKSISKGSYLRTDTSDSHGRLLFMELSDMLKASAGFVTGEMATFVCEILDYWPLLDLSKVPSDVKSHKLQENGDNEDNTGKLLAMEGDHFIILKKEFRNDLFIMAGILIGMRLYHNTVKPNNIFRRIFGCIDTGQIDVSPDKFMSNLVASTTGVESLHQQIENALLNVMVDCCQRLQGTSGEDAPDTNAESCQDTNEVSSQTKLNRQSSLANIVRSLIRETFFGTGKCMDNCSNTLREAILGQHDSTSESSEETLRLIVQSLKALNDEVTQVTLEQSQECHFVQKVLAILREAPKHLLPDLVSLLPKLACQFDHNVVGSAILCQLKETDADSSMRLLVRPLHLFSPDDLIILSLPEFRIKHFGFQVLEAMCQLKLAIDVWKSVFLQASNVVDDLNGEALGAAIALLFKAASQCQDIPQAVSIVRQKLQRLGADVSPCVLDRLVKTLNSSDDLAVTMLQKIDSVFSVDQEHLSSGEHGLATESLHAAGHHFSDIFMLLKMLAIPSIANHTMRAFEKGIANGFITHHLAEIEKWGSSYTERAFILVFGIADKLLQSRRPPVLEFLRKFYSMLFKLFNDENYQKKMLRKLTEMSLEMDRSTLKNKELSEKLQVIQDTLSKQKDKLVKLSNEKKEVVQEKNDLAQKLRITEADKNSLVEELRTKVEAQKAEQQSLSNEVQMLKQETKQIKREKQEKEEEIGCCKNYNDELEVKLNSLQAVAQEKNDLAKKLRKTEADKNRFVEELRTEVEAQKAEQQSLSNEVQTLKQELRQIKREKQEKEEEIGRCKNYNDELEVKLNSLQAVAQEKNDLAKKLRKTEADKNRFVKELRTEVEAQKAEQQSLSNEVQTLKQELRQIKREKQEKEEEIERCKNYNDELEVKLNSLQAVAQEKNDLAEKLRTAEAEKKNLAEELRRLTSQNEAKEAARRPLLDEVHRLRQKKQKEEEIEYYKTHNYELKQRLDTSMGKIQSLENSLHEERQKITSLIGFVQENLPMEQLQSLQNIHENCMRIFQATQQLRRNSVMKPQ
ncbi:TRAF-like family protein [Gossypium australe]|uniref:TRAF-like family protein n=1 Tax=Gossypium australe TaxID=47621 RepID=A0A5B6W4P1_9ROSI|nr:TRAF-like family protein [Gossypium australe]